ncbi:nucleotide exchange factor GrpE [Vibrio rumoiensis]|uniref:Protein GrpE n=1 Tax=Vibrio rumoiensis 1S-45 TaxID=1188252 RepID=A0A1E5E5U7_9VIBR|nr:nucleotide exchange factor GrpE [Vibrio rumoiensis]OEF28586.1 nucleotide exchange factor GrpE [Vibrio rumoiensis 1S-45]
MTDKQNKPNEEELRADEVLEVEDVLDGETIGGEGDIDWNEQEELNNEGSLVAELEAALVASQVQVKEQQDSVLRAKAEVENMRRRSEQEIDKARKYALNKFAEELLPVIDNLERALQAANPEDEAVKAILEGVDMTHKSFVDTVAKFGLVAINPEGEAFNPELHQAIGMQESPDHESNTVMIVMQKGYELNGRVIRPAMVMVAK